MFQDIIWVKLLQNSAACRMIFWDCLCCFLVQFVCIAQQDYCCILNQVEKNMQKVEEEGEIVMVKEHRELDRTGTRKGHIVIKVKKDGWICTLCIKLYKSNATTVLNRAQQSVLPCISWRNTQWWTPPISKTSCWRTGPSSPAPWSWARSSSSGSTTLVSGTRY